MTPEEIDKNLKQISIWALNYTQTTIQFLNQYKAKGLHNNVTVIDLSEGGGHSGQKYIQGLFDIEDNEALIYETTVPKECRYWSIQLTDMIWHSLDHFSHQVDLNGHTARMDSDGKFRAVIAKQDPGVANWLDTVGLNQGSLFGRWTGCSSTPTPSLTKVKFADIGKHLPKDTAMVTAPERDQAMRRKREGAQLRRRW